MMTKEGMAPKSGGETTGFIAIFGELFLATQGQAAAR